MIWYHVNEEFYGRHHERIDRYNEPSTPQMTMDLSHSVVFFVFVLFPFM